MLEDARRAVQGGGQGGAAGGKEVVAAEEVDAIYWEGEVKRGAGAISDLFDKIYKSEVNLALALLMICNSKSSGREDDA